MINNREFNPQIKLILEENEININDGFSYLLSLYYNLKPTIFSTTFINKVNACGIYMDIIPFDIEKWKYPLFVEEDKNFEWVNEYRDLFKSCNPERSGSKQVVIKRMKKLFSLYPHIRKDDVIEATKIYLKSINNYTYITTAERFLFKNREGSPILDWIEKLKENENLKQEEIMNDLI